MIARKIVAAQIALAACLLTASPAAAQSIKVTDDIGVTIALAAPPSRIISLAPNITEILFALGLGDRVAAVTRYCDYPAAAKSKPRIGGFLDPDIERIKSMRPDLIIAFRGNPLTSLGRLRDLGLPLFTLDIAGGLDAVPAIVAKIGAVTGRTAQADALRASLAAKAKAVVDALASVRGVPRVFLSLQGSGLWTFGGRSYFNDLLRRAKGVSVTASIDKAWFEYGRESLIRDDPDAFVILARTPEEFRTASDWFAAQAGLAGLRAVREKRFLRVDQDAASRFGPRLFDALDELARRLHPEAFAASPRR